MRLGSQNNQFIMNLPVDLIQPYLYDDFQKLLVKNWIPYDTALDYINSTIRDIHFPSMSMNVVEQTLKRGKKLGFKEVGNVQDKFSKELDITFKNVDSNLNYFMLEQILVEQYENVHEHHIPMFIIQIIDKNGDLLYTVILREIILKSISELRLGYNQHDISDTTFTVSFYYNWINIFWEMDDDDERTAVSIYDIPIKFSPGKLDIISGNVPYKSFQRKGTIIL